MLVSGELILPLTSLARPEYPAPADWEKALLPPRNPEGTMKTFGGGLKIIDSGFRLNAQAHRHNRMQGSYLDPEEIIRPALLHGHNIGVVPVHHGRGSSSLVLLQDVEVIRDRPALLEFLDGAVPGSGGDTGFMHDAPRRQL